MSLDIASFDRLIASSGRLRILKSLAAEPHLEFIRLRAQTRLTDGNLATHARLLESAGFISVEKTFRDRKPVTHLCLTPLGRDALERHTRELLSVLGWDHRGEPAPVPAPPAPLAVEETDDDDWVD